MASQFSGTNGTDIKTSAAPASAPKNLPPLKLPTLTPQTQLTGAAALLNRQRSTSPRTMPEDHKPIGAININTNEPPKQSPNPAALLDPGYSVSSTADTPKDPSPSRELGSLPGVAAAAAAMGERESPTTTTTTVPATEGTPVASGASTDAHPPDQYPPPQLHPPQPPQQGKDGGTPITPAPFSPPGSSAGNRGRHTCSHCMKTFTRHHNLKSHLLTHAHEKPYICNTCQARFRRLHDLKRHSKLHTGERPHVCPKCGRRFARGDALARHARGEGGCAGRRGSMSGLNEDGSMNVPEHEDEMGDLGDLMDDADGDVHMLDEDSGGNTTAGPGGRRRQSLPSIVTDIPNSPMTPGSGYPTGTPLGRPHNSTYPPPGPRSSATTNPPSSTSNANTAGTSPSLFPPSLQFKTSAPPSTNILSPGLITDSPGAVSPGLSRERTPSFTPNYLPLPPTAQNQTPTPTSATPGGTGSANRSVAPRADMSSQPTGTGNNVFSAGLEGVWAYIRTLEDRIKSLEDKLRE